MTAVGTAVGADLSGRRVMVVGSAGFLGRHILAALADTGAEAVGMDLAPAPAELAHLPWVTGSATDHALFATAAAGCDSVVFLANSSLPGTANFDLAAEIGAHVQMSVKAAEICNDQGVRRFVFASSGGTVYGYGSARPLKETDPTLPRNAYGASKLAIEHYLRLIALMRPMSTVALRVSNPYGEGQRALRNQGFVAAAMEHAFSGRTLPIWGDGTVERDFVHVSDVARAFVAACAAEQAPTTVNVGSGQGCSLLAMLDRISLALGRRVPVAFEPARQIDVRRNVLDVAVARDSLDWAPQVTLDAGLCRTADWWRAQASPTKGADLSLRS